MRHFYRPTASSYNSAAAVKAYARKLLPRRRAPLRRAILEFVSELPRNAEVLDLGCGTGKDVAFLRSLGIMAIGVDASAQMISYATYHVGDFFLRLDMRNLVELGKGRFGGVIAIASIQHIYPSDIRELFADVYSALTPDGVFFVFTKVGHRITSDVRLGRNYRRLTAFYTPLGLRKLAANVGFSILRTHLFILKRENKSEKWIALLLKKASSHH